MSSWKLHETTPSRLQLSLFPPILAAKWTRTASHSFQVDRTSPLLAQVFGPALRHSDFKNRLLMSHFKHDFSCEQGFAVILTVPKTAGKAAASIRNAPLFPTIRKAAELKLRCTPFRPTLALSNYIFVMSHDVGDNFRNDASGLAHVSS